MPAVLFWGTGARGSGTVPEVLGHENSPTCRLRVALQDFFEPRESEAWKQRLSNRTRGVEIPVFTRRMRQRSNTLSSCKVQRQRP